MNLAPRTAQEYAAVLKVGLSGHDLNLERIATWSSSRRTVFKSALRHAGLSELAGQVPRARRRRVDRGAPTKDELIELERAITKLPPHLSVMVALVLGTGLRSAEVLGLTRAAVARGAKSGSLAVVRKGDYHSTVSAAHVTKLLSLLLETPAARGGNWKTAGEVLSPEGNGHTQYCALRRAVRRAGRMAGLVLTPHGLRHAFAIRMRRRGAGLDLIRRALGHASPSTTLLYLDANDDEIAPFLA